MQPSRSITRLTIALLASSLVLAGCDNKSVDSNGAAATPPASVDAGTAAKAPAPEEMNEALSKEKVNVTLSVEGQPQYIKDEDVLLFRINVANNGQTSLVGVGTKPVHLAALLLGPEGADKAPGIRDFVSFPLPLIAKGQNQTVEAKLPAAALKGQTVQFQLLQPGVSWFDAYGQAPLNLSAYSRCEGAANTLCDNAGLPVLNN